MPAVRQVEGAHRNCRHTNVLGHPDRTAMTFGKPFLRDANYDPKPLLMLSTHHRLTPMIISKPEANQNYAHNPLCCSMSEAQACGAGSKGLQSCGLHCAECLRLQPTCLNALLLVSLSKRPQAVFVSMFDKPCQIKCPNPNWVLDPRN